MYVSVLLRFLSVSIRNGCKIEIMTEAIYVLSSTSSDKTSSDNDLEDEDFYTKQSTTRIISS